MDAAHWAVGPTASFGAVEASSIPELTITASSDTPITDVGRAVLRGVNMREGTVEFDALPSGGDMGGLLFRLAGDQDSDWLYVRLSASCATSGECLQYAPQRHGLMEWELFPEAQASAPIAATGWTHLRIVFGRGRVAVFVNRAEKPSLVARLEAGSGTGGLALLGPGSFAGVRLHPGDLTGLPVGTRPAVDRLAIRNWVAQRTAFGASATPSVQDVPSGGQWRPIRVEDNGLVNLSSQLGSPDGQHPSVAWLKTKIYSPVAQTRRVKIGWVRQVSVFVNGDQVFTDENLYGTPAKRKSPGGRVSLENGGFDLPLRNGLNTVLVAVGNRQRDHASRYGWGVMLQLEDQANLRAPRATASRVTASRVTAN